MADTNASDQILDKQGKTRELPATGFHTNPERINREGRPKRKTLTELIHAKLDDTPGAWDAIVSTVIQKVIKDKEKEIIKTFWAYTDGLPKQSVDLTTGGLPLPLLTGIADVSANSGTKEAPKSK